MMESIEISSIYYNSSSSIKTRKKSYIIVNIRELNIVLNTMYLNIYARLIVYVQLYLTYSKDYILYIRLIYNEYTIYNVIIPESFIFFHMLYDCVTVTVTCNINFKY